MYETISWKQQIAKKNKSMKKLQNWTKSTFLVGMKCNSSINNGTILKQTGDPTRLITEKARNLHSRQANSWKSTKSLQEHKRKSGRQFHFLKRADTKKFSQLSDSFHKTEATLSSLIDLQRQTYFRHGILRLNKLKKCYTKITFDVRLFEIPFRNCWFSEKTWSSSLKFISRMQ